MTNDTALYEALDRGIGPGPEGPQLDAVLRDGQRLVHRRRAWAATATLALVVAVGAASFAAVVWTADHPAAVGPASRSSEQTYRFDPPLNGEDRFWSSRGHPGDGIVSVSSTGEITFPADVTVVHHVDDALGRAPDVLSSAYEVREDGTTRWYLSRVEPSGPNTSRVSFATGEPGVDAATFQDWIAAQAAG